MSKIEASLAQLKMPDEIASLNPANVSVARLRKALHDVRRYSFHHHS